MLPKHDIVIIELDEPIDFQNHPNIRPLCLPDPHENVVTGLEATAAGWGLTIANDDTSQSPTLQKTNLKTISNKKCRKAYEDRNYFRRPDTRHLCAQGNNTDTCQGDSGGPLFAPRPKRLRRDSELGHRMELIGITSFGIGCNQPDVPGVYTKAKSYVGWMVETIKNLTQQVRVCRHTFGSWIPTPVNCTPSH